jgi:hypothetical protein
MGLYLGRIVEIATRDDLNRAPLRPCIQDPTLDALGGGREVACHLHKAPAAKAVPIVPARTAEAP